MLPGTGEDVGAGVATGIIQTGRASPSEDVPSGDGGRDGSVTPRSGPSLKSPNPQMRKAASTTVAISSATDAALWASSAAASAAAEAARMTHEVLPKGRL